MSTFSNLMRDLNKRINYVKTENIKDENITSMVEKIESELESASKNLEPLIWTINEKVKYYAQDFELAAKNEIQKEEKGQEMIGNLLNNEEILQKRRENLETMHKTSAQIKDMTDHMSMEVKNQGAILNEIEGKVIDAEENAGKAKKEIEEADKISKSNRKCYIFYIVLILVSLTSLGFLSWGIISLIKK